MSSNLNKKVFSKDSSIQEPLFNILIVEDNPGDVVIVTELLRASGISFRLNHASTLKATFALCMETEFDVILLDLGLTDSFGLETLKKIKVFKVKSPVVVMTGLDDEDTALASLREGAQDYLVKSRLTSDSILRSIKYGIERKKIEDLQKLHTQRFAILSSATGAISSSSEITSIHTCTCEHIRLLLGNANAVIIEFHGPHTIYISCEEWLRPWSDPIKTMAGLDLNNPVFRMPGESKELMGLFSDGKLHRINGGLYELSAGNIDRDHCEELEKVIGINNLYVNGFIKGKKFYGGVIIIASRAIDTVDANIIETICNHASLSIHRRSIEKDLRLSEARFRKLTKELEAKVKERTSDLESANAKLCEELIERNLAQEALKKSESQLKELNVTKDKFFNIVAHDLKNPFTSLLGSSELLFQNIHQMDKENIKKLALIVNDSAKSGFAILQNLLDWSRSQTGLLKFDPEKINLKSLIDEHILNLEQIWVNKEIEMYSEVDEDLFVFADKNMIKTVFRNLLGNAVKYSYRLGKVIVSAAENHDRVVISVRDYGIGIPEESINKIFRIDAKYSVPGTENEMGTGLGLKLCREFVEKHGGKIWVESVKNAGSDFKFSIPVKKSKATLRTL